VIASHRFALLAIGVLFAGALERRAAAKDLPYMGPSSGWYMPAGIDLAVAILPNSSPGALLGGEISLAYLELNDTPKWFGVFASAAYVTNANVERFSVGPEIGLAIFGLDGGLVDVVGGGQNAAGVTLRPMLTVGFATIYGRWDHTFANGGVDSGQIGGMLKFPFEVTGKL
jgi:hypothetical protein